MSTGYKTGGREKGTQNKIVQKHRQVLQAVLEWQIDSGRIQQELAKLNSADYLTYVLKLSALLIPKVTTEEMYQQSEPDVNTFVVTPVDHPEQVETAREAKPFENALSQLVFYKNSKPMELLEKQYPDLYKATEMTGAPFLKPPT